MEIKNNLYLESTVIGPIGYISTRWHRNRHNCTIWLWQDFLLCTSTTLVWSM